MLKLRYAKSNIQTIPCKVGWKFNFFFLTIVIGFYNT